jgi:transient receptor potential cation channel subfamily A protein 1
MTAKISGDPEDPLIIKQNYSNILDLAESLLIAVQRNNITQIRELVSETSDLLNYEYPPYDYQNILIIACNDQHSMGDVTKETIEALVELGAKCNEPSRTDHWEAIHYTALNANKEKMNAVIKYLSPQEINSLVYCSKQIPQKYTFCPNEKQRKTYCNNALNILLKYGNRSKDFHECCELLIRNGINAKQEDSSGVSPSDLIWKMHDDRLNHVLKLSTDSSPVRNSFKQIRLNSVQKFMSLELKQEDLNGVDGSDESTSSCTLLQLCCAKGLTSCVEFILIRGANPNKVIQKNPTCPVMIAISEDQEKIVKLFLKRNDLKLPKDILLNLQTMYKNVKDFATADKYMKMVLKYLNRCSRETVQEYLSAKDELQCSALHYATQYRCPDNAFALLSMGASLIEKDVFGNTPLDSIESHLLEKHFDNCIEVSSSDKIMSGSEEQNDGKFSVKINYESLIPKSWKDARESEFLKHMVKRSSLNHLLNHPIVASYLILKWEKLKWPLYINLFLYIVAYLSLLICGFASIETSYIFNVFLLIAFVLFVLREFMQILVLKSDYVKRVESFINLFLIAGLIYIIAAGWVKFLHNQNLLVAYSVVFLTSTLGIFSLLGNLSVFTIKVIILQEITINFFQYMLFYMFPVLAFFFCFYMLSENKYHIFFRMLYETVTMFAGDFNAKFPDQFTTNPIFSHLTFILFIILIGIILHNLLIGLAVSDLQNIQQQAEFIAMKQRSKYITSVEKIVFKKYQKSHHFKRTIGGFLKFFVVFESQRFLTVHSESSNCVYLKKNDEYRKKIRDKNLIDNLKRIFKNMSLRHQEMEDPYSLKSLHEKLQKMERLMLEGFKIPEKKEQNKSS